MAEGDMEGGGRMEEAEGRNRRGGRMKEGSCGDKRETDRFKDVLERHTGLPLLVLC